MALNRWLPVFLTLVILLLSAGSLISEVSADQNQGPLKFSWAFVGYSKGDSGGELVSIEQDVKLKSGDKFKFFFEMMQSGYVYLIMQSSQQDIDLLFPEKLNKYDAPTPPGGAFYVPSGANWFQLDDQHGQERFYVLVSMNRLLELEVLLKGYQATDGASKAAYKDKILKEIRSLRWKNRKFKKSAERPVAIMGQTRGVKKATIPDSKSVSEMATAIEAENFFSRTFTIDHQ